MRYTTIFPIILGCSILLISASLYGGIRSPEQQPHAVRGVLDLTAWDCKRDGPAPLNGEWEFYGNRLFSPVDLGKSGATNDRKFIRIPEELNPGWNMYDADYAAGYATYRLRVMTDTAKTDHQGLRINIIHPVYKLYVNGVLIHRDDSVVTDPERIMAGYSKFLVPLPADVRNGAYEIVVQAANYRFPAGCINFTVDIGCQARLLEYLQRSSLLSVLLVIAILILGLNQLILFLLQRTEPLYLYFGLSCLGVIIYTAGLHGSFWATLFPGFPWDGAGRFMTGALYIGNIFFIAYLRRLFPLDLPKAVLYVYAFFSLSLGLAQVVLPGESVVRLLALYHIHAFAASLLYIIISIVAMVRKRKNALINLAGLMTMPAGMVVDLLNNFNLMDRSLDTIAVSTLLFCMVQTTATMRNFISTYRHPRPGAGEYETPKDEHAGRVKAETRGVTDSIQAKINEATEYLRKNYTEDISRENLAVSIGMHPDSFSRYFKMHTGKKYNDFVNNLRINEAIRLLRETDDSIVTIAMNAGFRSLRTFNHAFMNAMGCSPGDFRKTH